MGARGRDGMGPYVMVGGGLTKQCHKKNKDERGGGGGMFVGGPILRLRLGYSWLGIVRTVGG